MTPRPARTVRALSIARAARLILLRLDSDGVDAALALAAGARALLRSGYLSPEQHRARARAVSQAFRSLSLDPRFVRRRGRLDRLGAAWAAIGLEP